MKKTYKKVADVSFEVKTLPISLIEAQTKAEDWDTKELKTRSAYFALNGAPTFCVNEKGNARFILLTMERDFHAVKLAGYTEVEVKIYKFTEKRASVFTIVERLKNESLGAMDEAYLMKKLIKEHGLTQNEVAEMVGKSRPCVANVLRLLSLNPEVVGLVESGKLTAGHARTLIKVPQDKQKAFAYEALRKSLSVREMERAVKAFLTPPEVLKREKEEKEAEKSAELKLFVEQMRAVFETKVSLIGNDKKGRIYIDYYSSEDLARIRKVLRLENEQLSLFLTDEE